MSSGGLPEQKEEGRPLIIVDWDDTFLPTSFLQEKGVLEPGCPEWKFDTVEELLDAYDTIALATLEVLKTVGELVFVTNASEGWVEHTSSLFMPEVAAALAGVQVWSARAQYEPLGVPCGEWKQHMFQRLTQEHVERGGAHHVFSLGDADYERLAVLSCAPAAGCVAHSVKLLTLPTVEQLTMQHTLLQDRLAAWAAETEPLDVGFADCDLVAPGPQDAEEPPAVYSCHRDFQAEVETVNWRAPPGLKVAADLRTWVPKATW